MKETTPWKLAAEIAASHIGQLETEGRNRSPFIRRMWRILGMGDGYYQRRDPWCAGFVCACLKWAGDADMRLQKPFQWTASVSEFNQRCLDSHIICVPWELARKGDVVSFLPSLSHIAIAEEVTASGLITIEGNTCPRGSRDGAGVHRRERAGAMCGSVWALPVGLGLGGKV